MSCQTPIAFLIFRRPDLTAKVFEAIRQAQPHKLFIVADGAHNESEAILCQQARAVTEVVDWDCEVFRNYADENLGCRNRVSSGLDWVFSKVEEAIILEDDCLPDPSFFRYCDELIELYRNDTRIFSVCGSNFQQGHTRGNAGYYFSIYGDSWGWATWKRAWQHYKNAELNWFNFRDSQQFKNIFTIPQEITYWTEILDELFIHKRSSAWDYQWWLASWMNSGLHAWPNVCLVSNIGWDERSTHTFGDDNPFAYLNTQSIDDLVHPKYIVPDRNADNYAFLYRRGGQNIIEQGKLGLLYNWKLRLLNLQRKGFWSYIKKKLTRFI